MKRTQGFVAGLRKSLFENLRPYFGKIIENYATGIKSRLSRKSAEKMGSEKAVEKSKRNGFTVQQHFEAANDIVNLYQNAILIENRPDKNGDINIRSIKRFIAPTILYGGARADAYITVKEATEQGHKIYSVELTEINKASAIANALGGATAKAADSST